MNGKKEELLKRLTEAIREIHSESIVNNKLNEPDTPLNKENLNRFDKRNTKGRICQARKEYKQLNQWEF